MSTRVSPRSPALRLVRHGLVAALIVLAGCKGNSNLPTAPDVPNPTGASLFSIEIEAPNSGVRVGGQLALEVEGKDDRDTPIDVTATWKSSDASVATVDAQGVVRGVKKGRVTITATTKSPPREATFEVTVVGAGEQLPPDDPSYGTDDGSLAGDYPGSDFGGYPGLDPDVTTDPYGTDAGTAGPAAPSGLALAIYPEVPRVAPGERIRLVALQGQAGSQAPAAAVWRSGDPSIAVVDEAGVVTAQKAGQVTITASSLAYPALKQQVMLSVIAPAPVTAISGIRIKPSRVTMNVGETFWLLAEVPTRDGGFDPLIFWESGDASIVTVSETGQVVAMAPGKTTITAISAGYTTGDLSAVVPVEVRNASIGFASGGGW
jgi:hypothetical protein